MLEHHVEDALAKATRKSGGVAFKWVSPGHPGVPDRIVILPNRILFVELKAPGKKPTPLQAKVHQQLRDLGCEVHTIDNVEAARAVVL